jgi:hypothetical protein
MLGASAFAQTADWTPPPLGSPAATQRLDLIAEYGNIQTLLASKLDDSQAMVTGLALLATADPAAARTVLGLGTAALVSSGAFAAAVHGHVAADISDFVSAADARMAAGIATHVAAPDPHPGYLTPAEGNATYATLAQGVLAITAVQPGDLATVATSGSYADLSDVPLTFAPAAHNQTASTITDFAEALDDRTAALLVAGSGVTLTYDDVAGTLTVAAGGGGSPGGSSGEVQYNDAGTFSGASDVEIEGGQLRLPAISTPTTPVAGGVKLFGRSLAGRILLGIVGPSGLDTSLQPLLATNRVAMFLPNGNSTTATQWGIAYTSTGTASTASVATTNRFSRMRGLEYLVTVAATTAVVGFRGNNNQWTIGAATAGDGGFMDIMRWGPAIGVSTTTNRAFSGMRVVTTPTDVETSSIVNMVGMGWDAADTNIQMMHNDGSGTATKIDLGASFPVPTVDRTSVYELVLFARPGTTQSVGYRVTDLVSGAEASGTITTDLPTNTTLIAPVAQMSVGGTSSVVGLKIFSHYIETDY